MKHKSYHYIWINASDPNLGLFEKFCVEKLGSSWKKIDTFDYTCWPAFITILIGITFPFIPGMQLITFLLVPSGMINWAIHILTLEKKYPAGTVSGRVYYKYRITFPKLEIKKGSIADMIRNPKKFLPLKSKLKEEDLKGYIRGMKKK